MMIVVLPVGILLVLLCNAWVHEVLRVEKSLGLCPSRMRQWQTLVQSSYPGLLHI